MAKKPTKKVKKEPKKRRLTPRNERFCQEYIVDLNGGAACRRAGFSAASCYTIAWELLRKPEIQARISELREEIAGRLNITKERVMQELAVMVFAKAEYLYGPDGELLPPDQWPETIASAVAAIEVEELFEGRGEARQRVGFTKKVKLWDKNKAIENLKAMMGWDAPKKIAQTDPQGNQVAPTVMEIVIVPPPQENAL